MTALKTATPAWNIALEDAYREVRALVMDQSALDAHRYSVYREAGRALREWRMARGISLRAQAKRLRVSAPFLSDVEHGKRNPDRVLRGMR